jgi:diguanylate cyclase (GGDEF)-like protein
MTKVTGRSDGKAGHSTRRTRLLAARAPSAKAGAKSAAVKTSSRTTTKSPKERSKEDPKAGRKRPGQRAPAAAKGASAALTIAALTRRLLQARRHIARLEAHADTDFLLDIPNRRGFERELSRSIAYVKRYRASAALLVVDVDRLKPINDRFGHAAGDHLLKTIVGVLSANIRKSDMLGRLGGDEFGVLLWNLGEHDAQVKAAALERAVDATVCGYRGRHISPGISVGVTVVGGDDEAARALARADQAMYARKQARRGKRTSALKR